MTVILKIRKLKKILFIIITLIICQLNYSQNKIILTEKDTLNSEIIENILDFENIKFKNYILKKETSPFIGTCWKSAVENSGVS